MSFCSTGATVTCGGGGCCCAMLLLHPVDNATTDPVTNSTAIRRKKFIFMFMFIFVFIEF
jgi:hypothetical protein